MNNVVDITVHGGGEIAAGIMNAVVGDAVLGEVVSADFFGAVAGADERFAGLAGVFYFFDLEG